MTMTSSFSSLNEMFTLFKNRNNGDRGLLKDRISLHKLAQKIVNLALVAEAILVQRLFGFRN